MFVIFILKKAPSKQAENFHFLKCHYFVIGGPIDMNVGVFWENFLSFLKIAVLQRFPKIAKFVPIWMKKLGQSLMALKNGRVVLVFYI